MRLRHRHWAVSIEQPVAREPSLVVLIQVVKPQWGGEAKVPGWTVNCLLPSVLGSSCRLIAFSFNPRCAVSAVNQDFMEKFGMRVLMKQSANESLS